MPDQAPVHILLGLTSYNTDRYYRVIGRYKTEQERRPAVTGALLMLILSSAAIQRPHSFCADSGSSGVGRGEPQGEPGQGGQPWAVPVCW